jgi:hypothetical protein
MTSERPRRLLAHLVWIGLPLAVLAIALGMTLWVTNTPGGEGFAESRWVGPFIFVLWVAGGVPLLVRLGRVAVAATSGSVRQRRALLLVVRVLGTLVVAGVSLLLALVILIDQSCWECVTPGKVVGAVVAPLTTMLLGSWAVWRRWR